MNGRVEVRRAVRLGPIRGSWRWWAIDTKGIVVAEREGYPRRRLAVRDARRLFPGWRIIHV